MIVKCQLLELIQLSDTLAAASQALDPLRYLGEVSEETIWQFYQPAIEYAIVNEQVQGEIDQSAKDTLQKMRF
jgi:hypothetical protein